jgi:suppressor of ftsI
VAPDQGPHSALAGAEAHSGHHVHGDGVGAAGPPLVPTSFKLPPSPKRTSNCPKHPPPFIHDSFPQPRFRHSRNGVLSTTLRAAPVPTLIDGKTYVSSVYDGTFPGPTLVFCPGDRLNILLKNRLNPADFPGAPHDPGFTNLHTHGLHVSPRSPEDNIFLGIPPGGNYQYRYRIPRDHPAGAYWYHPHFHGQTSPQTRSGMAGALIVEGGLDKKPAYRHIGQRILVIQKTGLGDGVTLPTGGPQPAHFFVNGSLDPKIPIRPGEIQRWSIFNATNGFAVDLTLGGQPMQLLARDGNYLGNRTAKRKMLIPPGSRREVLVKGGPHGSAKLGALPFVQFVGDNPPPETLATLVSRGPAAHDRMPPKRIERVTDLRKFKVDHKHRIVYTQNLTTDPVQFFINGKTFDPNRVDQVMHLGDVEQWTIINKSDEWHTFHIHINPFQLTKINGKPVKGVHLADNVGIPAESTITLLTRPTDYTGKFVFHCHVLGHEDLGMMATVVVKR